MTTNTRTAGECTNVFTHYWQKYHAMSKEQQKACRERSEQSHSRAIAKATEYDRFIRRKACTSLDDQDRLISIDSLQIIEQNKAVIEAMRLWDPKTTRKGALFYGSVGTGKSTLCKAVINKWACEQYRCLFINVGTMLERLRSAIDTDLTTVEAQMQMFIKPSLLVFDDLGAQKPTEWTYEKLFSIFDTRIAKKKHTLMTTNLPLRELSEKYGARFVDRIKGNCRVFKMTGESFRVMLNNPNEW